MKNFYCDFKHPENCQIKKSLSILADKWNLAIISLFHQNLDWLNTDSKLYSDFSLSFNQIKRELQSISSKVLTERLNQLVLENYLHKETFSEGRRKRTLYYLTKKGVLSKEVLILINERINN